ASAAKTTPASRRYRFVVAMFACPAFVISATGFAPAIASFVMLVNEGRRAARRRRPNAASSRARMLAYCATVRGFHLFSVFCSANQSADACLNVGGGGLRHPFRLPS